MQPKDKLHLAGILSAVLVLLGAGAAVPLAQGFVPYFNENVKNLEDTVPVLEDAVAADYKVSYIYHNEDGDKKTEVLGSTTKVVDGATAGEFNSTQRVLGIDLSLAALEGTPEYGAGADDHYVLITLPEDANLLFDETIRSYCAGFVLERGDGVDQDEDELQQSYTISIGSGDATLFTNTVRGQSEDDDFPGDADSNEVGVCKDNADTDDTEPDYGATLELETIQNFELAAYAGKDRIKSEPLWIKVTGVRAPLADGNETLEEGDVFDVALQFFTYPDTKMAYTGLANVQLGFGLAALVIAAFMTKFLNVPWEQIRPNSHKGGN